MLDNEFPPELFISFDVETLGPIPGKHSMLSLGCVALTETGEVVSTFYRTLEQLPDAEVDPDTEKFWTERPEAWDAARLGAESPQLVMNRFMLWLKGLMAEHTVSLIAYPAGFDFTFLYWYMQVFCGESPLMHSCIDLRSFIMGMTGRPFRRTSKKYWPARWRSGEPHTHNALDDAKEQGISFIKILQESRVKG